MTAHEQTRVGGAERGSGEAQEGLTQARLEKASGYAQRYVSGLERGRRSPTITTIYRIARALGT
jgi:transcriptional regulator with XRE-family HTH domain